MIRVRLVLFSILLLAIGVSCSRYQEIFYWSILRFSGEDDERIFLEFDDYDLEDVISLSFQNGKDHIHEEMALTFHVDQPWVTLPGLNNNKALISSGKDNKLSVPIKIINENLPSGEHQATIKITADNKQKLEVVIKMKHVPRIEVIEESLVFAINETEKELHFKSHDHSENIIIKKPSDAYWLNVSPTKVTLPKYNANDESTVAKINVSVDRTAVNYGSYKANLTICSENGAEIAVVPVEMLKEEFGDQVASSGNILFKILGCRPGDDGELKVLMSVKNTGSLDNEVVSFLGHSYSSSPKYQAYAIDNYGNAYNTVVRFGNSASSKSFAAGEETEATITIKYFKRSDISNISYIYLSLEGRSAVSFQNIGIQGRPINEPDFTPLTFAELLDAPSGLDIKILRSFYDSSSTLNIEYVVENTTGNFVDVILDPSRCLDCVYDEAGMRYDLDMIRLGLEATKYYQTDATTVLLPPHVKCRGLVSIKEMVTNSIQYIELPIRFGDQPICPIFKDVEVEGRNKLELPGSLSSTEVAITGSNGAAAFHVTRCYDTSSETIVEFRLENRLSDQLNITFNLDLCNSKDEYSLCYIPTKMMLAGSVAKSYQLPAGVYANGSLAFPKIDEMSASVDELQMSFLVDEELYSVKLGPVAIEGRKPSLITPQVLWESNGVTFSLIGCYEKSGNLLIDYLLNNTTDSDLELTLSADGRVFDDMANEYPIKLAGGSRYEYPKLKPKCSYRSQIIVNSLAREASVVTYFKLNMDIGALDDVVMELRNVVIEGRQKNAMSTTQLSYDVIQLPDRIDMQLLKAELKENQCYLEFRLKNNSSVAQSIQWDLYSTYSYAIIGGERHYINHSTIGFKSYNKGYITYVLPSNITVSGTIVIPDVSDDCNMIDELFIGKISAGVSYEFSNILINE